MHCYSGKYIIYFSNGAVWKILRGKFKDLSSLHVQATWMKNILHMNFGVEIFNRILGVPTLFVCWGIVKIAIQIRDRFLKIHFFMEIVPSMIQTLLLTCDYHVRLGKKSLMYIIVTIPACATNRNGF